MKNLILVFALIVSAEANAQTCTTTFRVTKTADTADGNCSTTDCSLREAVIAANNCAGDNEIVLPAGHYTLTRLETSPEEFAARGDLDVRGNLKIRGGSSGTTFVDGGGRTRLFDVWSGSLTLDRMTVQGGYAAPYQGNAQYGGAVRVVSSSSKLFVTNTVLKNNAVVDASGGAVYSAGYASFSNVQLLSNHAEQGSGGALALGGSGGDFTSLKAEDNVAANGGAISASGQVNIQNGSFTRNQALVNGGGAIMTSKGLYVTNSAFQENSAEKSGGAILFYVSDNNDLASQALIDRCKFSFNSARMGSGGSLSLHRRGRITGSIVESSTAGADGGGIDSSKVTLVSSMVRNNSATVSGGGLQFDSGDIVGSTIYGNFAAIRGGAIHSSGTVNLHNATLESNHAASLGGAIAHELGALRIKNSTIFNNNTAAIHSVWASVVTVTSIGHTVIGGDVSQGTDYCAIQGGMTSAGFNVEAKANTCLFTATSDKTNATVLLGALANNGGPACGPTNLAETLLTRAPVEFRSGLKNAGEAYANAIDDVSEPGCLKTDARGNTRPLEGRCDIGAVETKPAIVNP